MTEPVGLGSVATQMRSAFIHANVSDNLLQVAQLMQLARIRHLPVVEDGCLVGIVSHRDVMEYSACPLEGTPHDHREHLRGVPVSSVMNGVVHTISPDATLSDAAREMLRYKIGCLPVVLPGDEASRIVGLITESDLLAAAYLPRFDARTLEPRVAGARAE